MFPSIGEINDSVPTKKKTQNDARSSIRIWGVSWDECPPVPFPSFLCFTFGSIRPAGTWSTWCAGVFVCSFAGTVPPLAIEQESPCMEIFFFSHDMSWGSYSWQEAKVPCGQDVWISPGQFILEPAFCDPSACLHISCHHAKSDLHRFLSHCFIREKLPSHKSEKTQFLKRPSDRGFSFQKEGHNSTQYVWASANSGTKLHILDVVVPGYRGFGYSLKTHFNLNWSSQGSQQPISRQVVCSVSFQRLQALLTALQNLPSSPHGTCSHLQQNSPGHNSCNDSPCFLCHAQTHPQGVPVKSGERGHMHKAS